MASNLLALANEVIYAVGNRTELATNAKLWVNRAYQRIQDSAIDIPETHAAVTSAFAASTTSYSLPADFFSVISIKNLATDRKIASVSLIGYDRLSSSATGSPSKYAIRGRTTLLVWPSPTAADNYQLTYRKRLPDLVLDADVHVLPVSWEEAIILSAAAFGFEYLNELDRAASARAASLRTIGLLSDRMAADLVDRDEPAVPIGLQTGVIS